MKRSRHDRDKSRQAEMRIATDRDNETERIATAGSVVNDSQSQKNRGRPPFTLKGGGGPPQTRFGRADDVQAVA